MPSMQCIISRIYDTDIRKLGEQRRRVGINGALEKKERGEYEKNL